MPGQPHGTDDLHGAVPDTSKRVLLVLDMFSEFSFDGGARAARLARPVAHRIAALQRRCRRADIPIVYINDNAGRWRSNFSTLVRACSRPGSRGAAIARLLKPRPLDYCVLKPKHSGFYATPLALILEKLGAEELILTGIAGPQCILFTATDAYVRDYRLLIPSDCIVSLNARDKRCSDYFFTNFVDATLTPSASLQL